MDTAPGHPNQNYAQILIKRSNAQGQVMAAFRLTPHCGVGVLLLRQLQAMVRDRLGTVTVTAKSHERLFASLVSTVHAVTKVGPCAEDEVGNDTGMRLVRGYRMKNHPRAATRLHYEGFPRPIRFFARLPHSWSPHGVLLRRNWNFCGILCGDPFFCFQVTTYRLPFRVGSGFYLRSPSAMRCRCWYIWWRGLSGRLCRDLVFLTAPAFSGGEVESGEKTASIQCKALYPKEYNVNSPHKLLIEFLSDCYVDIRGPVSFHPSVLLLLHHLAMRVVEAPSRFSTKDSSFSEMMRCALLMSSICHNLQIVNERRLSIGSPAFVASASIGKVRQGWYKCLLQWFHKTPPSWYFTRDPSAAEEELVVLQKLIKVLDADRDALLRSTHGFLDFDPSKIHACTAAKFTLMGSGVRIHSVTCSRTIQ
ncbi:putative phosphatidylinositol 4-kinase alpha [Trypanosoma cruzi]|uniref:Putative phosphatidylinositol 4-kinase alpha n=1 Tax=Trypanosoma cruzi TaxID=5693 RepID=A0A2V2WWJ7_TRYCR|nr:putative phosphatidylinositol 4-kinase alpha [Trypanosoma cruzi]